ncbi:MAG: ATP-binding cassette domain-containing protein [Bryobacteraceae bacterium]|nr:ATP-binding cassette domain-containing protein [Bryobacteraceae bacterium]
MISATSVSMRYGAKVLFEDVNIAFTKGNRYGLTGPNGAGKSTFMKVLSGELEPQVGSVVLPRKLGVLKQDQFAFDQFRVLDTVIMGNKILWEALQEREVLYAKADLTDEDGMRLGELEGVVGDEDGYEAESNAAILLAGIGLPAELHERQMSELQGGQKVRVLLAQALFGNPDALLLDEPTNHLDLDSIHWLEDFLTRYSGTVICISHDRHFLNNICTHIADIDYQTIIIYPGGYDDMVLAKTQVRSRIEAENAQRAKKIAQLNDFIARFAAGTRSSQVASRKKEVERLQPSDLARSNIQRPFIRFQLEDPSGRTPLEIENIAHAYGDGAPVWQNFRSLVDRGDKIGIMGRNGAGKTTLLRALLKDAPGTFDRETIDGATSGAIKWGHNPRIGYFAQDHRTFIDEAVTVFEWLQRFDPKASQQELRGLLGQMLFSGEEGMKQCKALSGGEAARLMFCRLMLEKPNFLIFDEPTNHLDLESINALNVALQKYEGTVLLVTHDEDLLDEVATRIWYVGDGRIEDFKGPYAEFEKQHQQVGAR